MRRPRHERLARRVYPSVTPLVRLPLVTLTTLSTDPAYRAYRAAYDAAYAPISVVGTSLARLRE